MRLAALVFAVMIAFAGGASAEPRVALVIGNSNYGGDLGQLPNPANDAKLMAKTLKGIGFAVVEAEDADQAAMKRAIQDFGARLGNAGDGATGLFFYAGHGLQVAGTNYLIPIHAQIAREPDVDIEGIPVDLVMKQMAFAGSAVNIVILDACRNNPLSRGFRAITRGLADPAVRPMGSFIAYSTAPGDVAEDGKGANSPYTTALVEAIAKPGASINDVFQEVRGKVLAATDKKQIPWDSSSLTAPFYFVPAVKAAPVAAVDSKAIELAFWDAIKDSTSAEDFQAYLDKFPEGEFASLAKLRVKQNDQSAARMVHPEVALPEAGGPADPAAIEQAFWSAVEEDASSDGYQAYLKKYPNGTFADRARKHVAAPATQQAAVAPPPPEIVAINAKLYAKDKARLRDRAASDATIVARLSADTPLTATGRSADEAWWRVTLADGRAGFIAATAVTDQAPPPAPALAAGLAPAPAPAAKVEGSDSDICYAKIEAPAVQRGETCQRLLAAGIADETDRYNALIDLGQALYDQGRGGEAMKPYRDAVELDPKFYGAYYLMGRVHLDAGRYADARAAFDKAVALDPEQSDPLMYRGAASWRVGELDPALSDIERAIAINADNSDYFAELSVVHLAKGDVAAAMADTDRALALASDYSAASGIFALYLSHRYDEGVAMADRAIKGDPGFLYWWIWKAMIQRAKGDAAVAAATLAAGQQALGKADWPAPLADYLTGKISEVELRRLGRSGDAKTQAERDCEIAFYVGVQALFSGDQAAAAASLRRARETRVFYYVEIPFATAQLAALGGP